jgi:hypothetical protein
MYQPWSNSTNGPSHSEARLSAQRLQSLPSLGYAITVDSVNFLSSLLSRIRAYISLLFHGMYAIELTGAAREEALREFNVR